jgi:hypothetical protein
MIDVTTLSSFIINGDWKYNNSKTLVDVVAASTNTTNSNKKNLE